MICLSEFLNHPPKPSVVRFTIGRVRVEVLFLRIERPPFCFLAVRRFRSGQLLKLHFAALRPISPDNDYWIRDYYRETGHKQAATGTPRRRSVAVNSRFAPKRDLFRLAGSIFPILIKFRPIDSRPPAPVRVEGKIKQKPKYKYDHVFVAFRLYGTGSRIMSGG